jgi:hypothetical protein
MKIETKFNAGDEVYAPVRLMGSKEFRPQKTIIDKIRIYITKESVCIYYDWLRSFWTSNDEELFSTEEKCQSECDRLNEAK